MQKSPIKLSASDDTTSGVVWLQYISEAKITDSRGFRKKMTPAEARLWTQLRSKKVGNLKFRRQQIIEGFIADFFCEEGKFCVEVDGGIHKTSEQAEIDKYRTLVFKARGIRVLRISNSEVMSDLSAVVRRILLFRKKV